MREVYGVLNPQFEKITRDTRFEEKKTPNKVKTK